LVEVGSRKSAVVERDCRAEWALEEGLLELSSLLEVSVDEDDPM